MPQPAASYREMYLSLFNDVTTQIRRLERLPGAQAADIAAALRAAQQRTEEMYIGDFRPEAEIVALGERG